MTDEIVGTFDCKFDLLNGYVVLFVYQFSYEHSCYIIY